MVRRPRQLPEHPLSPSWLHPSGICGIPFSVHHFLLHSALRQVFGERVSAFGPKNVFMHVLTGYKGSRGKKETTCHYVFAQCLIFLLIFRCFLQGSLSFSAFCPSRAGRLCSPGAEGSVQEARGGSRLGVWWLKLGWSFISFSPDHYSLSY